MKLHKTQVLEGTLLITCADENGMALSDATIESYFFAGGETGTSPSCSEPCFAIDNLEIESAITFNCSKDGYKSAIDAVIPAEASLQDFNITVELQVNIRMGNRKKTIAHWFVFRATLRFA